MYKSQDIRVVHMETTTKCNAACPMCLRTVCGGKANPYLPLTELRMSDIRSIFSEDFVRQLKRMYMCGNYGDPIIAQDTLEIFTYFREINPKIRLKMFTNGSARDQKWWGRLATVVDQVHFSIDGLEDSNHIYRRGTQFSKIMESAKAFIANGGNAIWDYIVFRHNEHQVEEAKALSESMGFEKISVKKTGRFFSNVKVETKDRQVVYKKSGEVDYYLELPEAEKYQNKALAREESLVNKYGSLESYLNKTPIQCKASDESSMYLSAEGHAFPCCWTANQLYPWYYPEKKSYMWKLVNELPGGLEDLSAKTHMLEDIIDGPFFQKVVPCSWEKPSIKEGRPKCCAKTCGTEFDPFRAQFQ